MSKQQGDSKNESTVMVRTFKPQQVGLVIAFDPDKGELHVTRHNIKAMDVIDFLNRCVIDNLKLDAQYSLMPSTVKGTANGNEWQPIDPGRN